MFVGRDLLQLVVAPVRTRDIFVARLATAMTANLLISGVLLAAVLGLGAGAGAPLIYFPLGLLLIPVQVLLVSSLQPILMPLIFPFLPPPPAPALSAPLPP